MALASRILHTRWLVRSPITLFRSGLGFLAGGRLLLLAHRGRTTGATRYVVLEVTDRPAPGTWVVVAGLGPRSQWYRNVVADPRVLVWVGWRRHVRSTARTLAPDDGARLLRGYATRHERDWAMLEPVLREWAEPLAAEREEADWRRVVPVVELTALGA
ncbi:nitroreductase family deazaflavin-dependent oxidoreductase [Cellulosimicrobium sp. NPDC055967]|uniref:nitroreductase family deazaflavin-dependent oxidoreductase n=1 Tax=Cellulosimicrobium sp. NPDC055967 TaxID=3345670 RepID=UPI0035E2EC54